MRYTGQILKHRAYDGEFKQVNKTVARKMYEEGKTILLHSCNMYWDNQWTIPMEITTNPKEIKFDTVVNEYEYYNCDSERGYYSNYFLKIEKNETV